jgi:hypothetical protein
MKLELKYGVTIIPDILHKKMLHLAQRMVTRDIPIERETLQVYFAYLINAICVRPVGRGRRLAYNPFPPIPAAASHDRFLRWQR